MQTTPGDHRQPLPQPVCRRVNFCNGTSHSVVENSHFRNTGDDALASWSPKGDAVNTGNVFRFNTVQIPWRANCFAIYGGKDNRIEDNLCYDVLTYPGILIAQQFHSNPFEGNTFIQRNSLVRTGGPMFNLEHGALKIWSAQGDISGLVVNDILIESHLQRNSTGWKLSDHIRKF